MSDKLPRTIQTRCISHIMHLLYRWSEQTPAFPKPEGFDDVQFAQCVITWWDSVKSDKSIIDQEHFIPAVIPHLEDYIHVSLTVLF